MNISYKFGDIVENEWAGEDNPQRILMVRHNGSRYVHCLSRRGKMCKFAKDKDLKLTKVGKVDFARWDDFLFEQL